MASQNGSNRLAFGIVILVVLWLVARFAVGWAPAAGWVNIVIGIAFLAAVIGSIVFLLRMAKSIGKSE